MAGEDAADAERPPLPFEDLAAPPQHDPKCRRLRARWRRPRAPWVLSLPGRCCGLPRSQGPRRISPCSSCRRCNRCKTRPRRCGRTDSHQHHQPSPSRYCTSRAFQHLASRLLGRTSVRRRTARRYRQHHRIPSRRDRTSHPSPTTSSTRFPGWGPPPATLSPSRQLKTHCRPCATWSRTAAMEASRRIPAPRAARGKAPRAARGKARSKSAYQLPMPPVLPFKPTSESPLVHCCMASLAGIPLSWPVPARLPNLRASRSSTRPWRRRCKSTLKVSQRAQPAWTCRSRH